MEPDNVGLCGMWEWLDVVNKLDVPVRNPPGMAQSPSWNNLASRHRLVSTTSSITKNMKSDYLNGALALLQSKFFNFDNYKNGNAVYRIIPKMLEH